MLALLDRGADTEHQNQAGRNALHVAASRGNLDAVQLLLAREFGAPAELLCWGESLQSASWVDAFMHAGFDST